MKKIILFIAGLFFVGMAIASDKSLVFNEGTSKVLYADYPNRIRLIPNSKSHKTILKGEGMKIVNEGNGVWKITPYQRVSEAVIHVMELRGKDTVEIEPYVFAVKALPMPTAYLTLDENKLQFYDSKFMIKEFLDQSCKILVDYGFGCPLECPIEVYSFSVTVGGMVFSCEGNTISQDVKEAIKQLNHNTTIIIGDIRARNNGFSYMLAPLQIELLDEISYYQRW